MEHNISPNIQKWMKKCLKKEFETKIQKGLEEDMECANIIEEIIHSKEMSGLLSSMRATLVEQSASRSSSTLFSESRPQSSLSCLSDQTSEDWNSPLNNDEYYNIIVDKISNDKPTHVRLAAYEVLLKNDLSNVNNNPVWDSLKKALLDSLVDENRPIFEASLQVHAKLLTCLQSHDVYKNLLVAFTSQYDSQKTFEVLPTLVIGINFKFFLHERVFRIIRLILQYHEERLKSVRNPDKSTEELVEEFMLFLSTHDFGNVVQSKTLNILNIISILDPCANWSKKWIVSLATRRLFLIALGKSPSIVQSITGHVTKGLEDPPHFVSISICDEPMEVIVNGNTIDTVTYLHCLCFVSQLCAHEGGRKLLEETNFETPFQITDFLTASLKALNKLSIDTLNGAYDVSCYALQIILDQPTILYVHEFYHLALCHLPSLSENNIKIWPHTLNIILHMLDTTDGSLFLISECKEHTVNFESNVSKCPAMYITVIASNMLRQPFSIMNNEYLLKLFKVLEKLFDVFDAYEILQYKIENEFYPAVSHFYSKLDTSYFENENKVQQINSAITSLLLKMVSIPSGLKALIQESSVFHELIAGCIAPLRMSWTSMEVVHFVTVAAFFRLGYNTLANLAPHILSTLLSETCQILEDIHYFDDPWDHKSVHTFLHILAFFSLNFKCFSAFMTNVKDLCSNEEENYPPNLFELFKNAINPNSNYHYLGLLSLLTVVWNLNIRIYLIELLNFQNILLELQNSNSEVVENKDTEAGIIDEYTLVRHKILSKADFMKLEDEEEQSKLEEYDVSILPTRKLDVHGSSSEYDDSTELDYLLKENTRGLLDSDWIEEARGAYKSSSDSMKNATLIQLLDQMHKAIPTAEWVENFHWQESDGDGDGDGNGNGNAANTDFWFAEEIHGINLALYYAEQNDIFKNTVEMKKKLQEFISECYAFIRYEKPKKFDGFDWFLATVFIICEGNVEKKKNHFLSEKSNFKQVPQLTANIYPFLLTKSSTSIEIYLRVATKNISRAFLELLICIDQENRETLASRTSSSAGLRLKTLSALHYKMTLRVRTLCKVFVTQLMKFPVIVFLWPNFGKVVDQNTQDECTTQFMFMQLLESIVSNELPHVKFALKSTSGISWSLMCNLMIAQCFWGTIPWTQILHFFAICILHSPDYIIYYCASLLHYCQNTIMQHVTSGKMWPEHMILDDYQSHNYIRFMDTLDKRYGNKILPKLSVKALIH